MSYRAYLRAALPLLIGAMLAGAFVSESGAGEVDVEQILKRTRTAVVFGQVLDTSNRPVANAEVSVEGRSGRTDDSGSFSVSGVPPGAHEVRIRFGDRESSQKINLAIGDRTQRVFYVDRGTPSAENELGLPIELVRNPGVNRRGLEPLPGSIVLEALDTETLGFDILVKNLGTDSRVALVQTKEDDVTPRFGCLGSERARLAFQTSSRSEPDRIWMLELGAGFGTGSDPYQARFRPPQVIGPGRNPTWSSDCQSVIFERETKGNIELFARRLGPQARDEQLTHHAARDRDPFVGNLGGVPTLVFSSDRTGVGEIWSLPEHGSSAKRLTELGKQRGHAARGPVVSPDGQQIAFWLEEKPPSVWVAGADGSRPQRVVAGARDPNWGTSTAGERFLYVSTLREGAWQVGRVALPPPSEGSSVDPVVVEQIKARERETTKPPPPVLTLE